MQYFPHTPYTAQRIMCTVQFGVPGEEVQHDFNTVIPAYFWNCSQSVRLMLKWHGFKSQPVNQKSSYPGVDFPEYALSVVWPSMLLFFFVYSAQCPVHSCCIQFQICIKICSIEHPVFTLYYAFDIIV